MKEVKVVKMLDLWNATEAEVVAFIEKAYLDGTNREEFLRACVERGYKPRYLRKSYPKANEILERRKS